MHTYTAYKESDYSQEVIERIATTKQGDRVTLISMLFEPSEQLVNTLTKELIGAAKRGADVNLVLDAHSFMLTRFNLPLGPIFWRRNMLKVQFPRPFYEKVQLLEELRRAGGHYTIINEPATWPSLPIAGRSHIKATIINNEAYIGGCNLGWTGQIDYMVRIQDTATATWIRELVEAIAKHKSVWAALEGKDTKRVLDKQTTLFVDAGTSGQSRIFEEALRFMDEAKEWLVITCQFLPSGITGQHLVRAQERGVKVYSVFNHVLNQDRVTLPAQYLIQKREQLRMPNNLLMGQLPVNHQRLHAKLIASEQGAMVGSHNYVTAGVKLGTAETALLRMNPTFARQAMSLLIPQIASGSRSRELLKNFG